MFTGNVKDVLNGKHVIIISNCDIFVGKRSQFTKNLFRQMKCERVKQRIQKYTKCSFTSNTSIDLALSTVNINTEVTKRLKITDKSMVTITIPNKNDIIDTVNVKNSDQKCIL